MKAMIRHPVDSIPSFTQSCPVPDDQGGLERAASQSTSLLQHASSPVGGGEREKVCALCTRRPFESETRMSRTFAQIPATGALEINAAKVHR